MKQISAPSCGILTRILLLPILFIFFGVSHGQQPSIRFTQLTNKDGLSQSTVQAIMKDRYGFMWFGTQDGLNRYDGYSFKIYKNQYSEKNSLSSNDIYALHEDRKGNIWIGTRTGGLNVFDRRTETFQRFIAGAPGSILNNQVNAITEDKDGIIWIGTLSHLSKLDPATKKLTHYKADLFNKSQLFDSAIFSLYTDREGQVWVGTGNGLHRYNKKKESFEHYSIGADNLTNMINAICEDHHGNLWLGTGKGLFVFNKATHTVASINGCNQTIYAITQGQKNQLWVASIASLDLIESKEKKLVKSFSAGRSDPSGINDNIIYSLLYDQQGILWVGTCTGGINKYDPGLSLFRTYQSNHKVLGANTLRAVDEDKEGNLWIGTDGGLARYNRVQNQYKYFNHVPGNANSLAYDYVMSVVLDETTDDVWVGTYSNGLNRYNKKTDKFTHLKKGPGPMDLSSNRIYALYQDRRKKLWISTVEGGINVLDVSRNKIDRYQHNPYDVNSIPENNIQCVYEDEAGNVWVGAFANGVAVYNPSTQKFTRYNQKNSGLSNDAIYSIIQDSKGNIWVGTGGGLNRFNQTTKRFDVFTEEDGLPSNVINHMAEDSEGFIWISTLQGISRFDPATKKFKNFSIDHGLQGTEFLVGAGCKTKKGDIVFGGLNGFNIIHPSDLLENKWSPKVVFTGFKLFNKKVLPGTEDAPLDEDIMEAKNINLSYKQTVFSIEFTSLNYTLTERNQYAYKLQGFDDDWVYAANNRTATYTNLDPGTYTFEVKAANSDGVWSNQPATLRIVVHPPFWLTWWFKGLCLIALVGAAAVAYKLRIRAIERQKRILEQQVKERTESLAKTTQQLQQSVEEEKKMRTQVDEALKVIESKNRELEQFAYVASHDMKEPLRTISSFVNMLQQQYKGKLDEKADKYMGFITGAAERMKTLIDDLLEYSRIGRKKEAATVDLNQLVGEVVADLKVAIEEAKAEVSWAELPTLNAYPTEMKQIIQNLIANAIKFRKKDTDPRVIISSAKVDGHWQLSVKDNGIGIDQKHIDRIFVIFQRLHSRQEYEGSGIGLSNCKKIAELHGGEIWVESAPGQGSNFMFTVKEQLN